MRRIIQNTSSMGGVAFWTWVLLCSSTSTTYAVPHATAPTDTTLLPCGDAWFEPDQYTCWGVDTLCPIITGTPTRPCGDACYLPSEYTCVDGGLQQVPTNSSSSSSSTGACATDPTSLFLTDPPYSNYFLSTCNSAAQVVVTSPLDSSNLSIIGPRLIVAWPAGNSGTLAFFAPENGVNGTLSIRLLEGNTSSPSIGGNVTSGKSSTALSPVYINDAGGNATVGVEGAIYFNDSAVLTISILGSVRTLRDFVEGPSLLQPVIQNATQYLPGGDGATVTLSRLWLDNTTVSNLTFTRTEDSQAVTVKDKLVHFTKGIYHFSATLNYPQLKSLSPVEVLNNASQSLLTGNVTGEWTRSLSFLSTTDKLLAGAWRFLTYFGRDSLISLLLMEPILSSGNNSAIEAGLGAAIARVNASDGGINGGSVCHEETIGDYATYLNLENNITSTAPQCDYKMVDSDYYLQVFLATYLLDNPAGKAEGMTYLKQTVSASKWALNEGTTYYDLAMNNAKRIMDSSAPFAAPGNQTKENLIHLKVNQIVGQWRDSTYGIGGGRIPFDVNTALVPAGLRAIARLTEAGYYSEHAAWKTDAPKYAKIWEDSTLEFFEVRIPTSTAVERLKSYVTTVPQVSGLPSSSETIDTDEVFFYAISLDGNNDLSKVEVMHSDDCFRHFLLKTTNQTQLTTFLNQTANNILRPFPAGLLTPLGVLIANPAYGEEPVYAQNFSTNAYHGTVIWSWNSLSMMGKGLEIQLLRCTDGETPKPDFCSDESVYGNVKKAYGVLWDTVDANEGILASEVWTWRYTDGKYVFAALGELPPPAGVNPTEADVRQLWSLTFLAVKRNENL